MSDANSAAPGTGAPTTTTDPKPAAPANAPAAAAPPPAAPAATPPPDADPTAEPGWLKERLARERKKALADLGVDDPEAVKRAIAAERAAADAKKSAEERAAEARAEAAAAKADAEKHKAAATEAAARMLVGLTDAQRKAVTDIAGDDPAAQIRAVVALQATWSSAAPAASTPAAAPKPAAAPASTAPAHAQPGDGTTGPTNHRAVYEATRETNPFQAAIEGLRHPDVYVPKQS